MKITAAILSLLTLVGCQLPQKEDQPDAASSAIATVDTKKFISAEYGFSFEYPADWGIRKSSEAEAGFGIIAWLYTPMAAASIAACEQTHEPSTWQMECGPAYANAVIGIYDTGFIDYEFLDEAGKSNFPNYRASDVNGLDVFEFTGRTQPPSKDFHVNHPNGAAGFTFTTFTPTEENLSVAWSVLSTFEFTASSSVPFVGGASSTPISSNSIGNDLTFQGNDINTIRNFYNNIEADRLQQAYSMYEKKKVSFETFSEWYAKVESITPRSFTLLRPNTYRFFVDLKEERERALTYRVTMEVRDDLINTLASEIWQDDARFGDMFASSRLRLGYQTLVLEKDGKETEIDRSKDEIGGHAFGDLRFSTSGKYLLYTGYGYEWTIGFLYDILHGKRIFELEDPGTMVLTEDENYLYECTANHFSGKMRGDVYEVPSMKKVFSFMDSVSDTYDYFVDIDCSYDIRSQQVTFVGKGQWNTAEWNTAGSGPIEDVTVSLTYDLQEKRVVNTRE